MAGARRSWEADPTATFVRRFGLAPRDLDLGNDTTGSQGKVGCPDIWQLSNGDVAVIGRDLTEAYRDRLPEDASIRHDERLVVLPGKAFTVAKRDIPDA